MRVDNISPVSYQAHLPDRLRKNLFNEALSRNNDTAFNFVKQVRNFESWGQYNSTLSLIDQGKQVVLGLKNTFDTPLRKVALPFKMSLLDSFMALNEKDVIEAEHSLMV